MSDHPIAGIGIGGFEREIGADGGAERTHAVLDVRRARAFGGGDRLDDIGAVDVAGTFLAGEDRLAVLVDVDSIFDMARPAVAGPPDHVARREVVAGQDFHASVSAVRANAASRSSASDRSTTS